MRFVFDTSVLIDYLRGDEIAADALFAATEEGTVYVTLISLMELWLPRNKSNDEIQKELMALKELCQRLDIRIVPCTSRAQEHALSLLENYRSPLGKNALPDSLIIASGMTRRACLVTTDKRWFDIARNIRAVRILSPEELVMGEL